jgi:hypothetical protein
MNLRRFLILWVFSLHFVFFSIAFFLFDSSEDWNGQSQIFHLWNRRISCERVWQICRVQEVRMIFRVPGVDSRFSDVGVFSRSVSGVAPWLPQFCRSGQAVRDGVAVWKAVNSWHSARLLFLYCQHQLRTGASSGRGALSHQLPGSTREHACIHHVVNGRAA